MYQFSARRLIKFARLTSKASRHNGILRHRLFVLLTLVSLASGHALASQEAAVYLMPFQLNNSPELMPTLKRAGVTTISFPIVWAKVETEQGKFDFSYYTKHLDTIVDNGFKLVLILDTSERFIRDPTTGESNYHDVSVPGWVRRQRPDAVSRDFTGKTFPELDLFNPDVIQYLYQFYHQASDYYLHQYPGSIESFALGFQREFEIKYGQEGYAWRNYSPAAQKSYSEWSQGKPLPIINYNNNINAGQASTEPDFDSFMKFREFYLAKHVCKLSSIIRNNGGKVSGYFGEMFTSHDAIYAIGIIEDVVPCFDIATVDYNFNDGYQRVANPWIPVILTNYARHLGYQDVRTGYYLEKWRDEDNLGVERVQDQILGTVSESLNLLRKDGSGRGIEIGGFPIEVSEIAKIQSLDLAESNQDTQQANTLGIKIGILASKTNYYLWHGERSFSRNLHSDALIEAYKMFFSDDDFVPIVIGEKTITDRPDVMSALAAVFIPHQTTIGQRAEKVLEQYNDAGLALIQDMRFSTFAPNGHFEGDWENERFGISGVDWKNQDQLFSYHGKSISITKQDNSYASHAVLLPRATFQLLMPLSGFDDRGLMIRGKNTLALGFMPQLLQGGDSDKLRRITLDEIKTMVGNE